MATPFVSDALFEITVKYVQVNLKGGLKAVIVIDDPEKEKKYGDRAQVIKSQWKQPNWKEHNELHSDSLVTDDVTGVKVPNINIYRQLVLERFMKLWDIVDDKGNPIDLKPENLAKLDPDVAMALYQAWNKRVNAEEEDTKN